MKKRSISALRKITFLITVVTSVPLFINYLQGAEPRHELVIHLHTWFGAAFIIFAILGMIANAMEKSRSGKKD